jgi:hypothetical protein
VSFTFTTASQPVVTNPGAQIGTIGVAVSKSLTASGGASPYTWSATGLPAGLSINNSTGTITGKPSTAGTPTTTMTVTDAGMRTGTAAFAWSVATAPEMTSPGNQKYAVGQNTSLALSAGGGDGPYRWTASGLPAGLSINGTTGVISGTPSTTGPRHDQPESGPSRRWLVIR